MENVLFLKFMYDYNVCGIVNIRITVMDFRIFCNFLNLFKVVGNFSLMIGYWKKKKTRDKNCNKQKRRVNMLILMRNSRTYNIKN